jgi:RND superfamily putative drug exporter
MIGAWLLVVVGLFVLRSVFGGTYVNDYTVPGSESSAGLSVLNHDFSNQGGYAGSILFHATSGKVSDQANAVKTSMAAVSKLPDVVAATDPLANSQSPYVSKDGTVVNAPVSFSVVPASLHRDYLDSLDAAVQPARAAGLEVEYGGGAGQIGKQADDTLSEAIGLALALLLLFLMFRSVVAAGLPLVSAVFSVGGGLAILWLLAAAKNFPTSAPTVATLLGLGVAIDYGPFLLSRHRERYRDARLGWQVVAALHSRGRRSENRVHHGLTPRRPADNRRYRRSRR